MVLLVVVVAVVTVVRGGCSGVVNHSCRWSFRYVAVGIKEG